MRFIQILLSAVALIASCAHAESLEAKVFHSVGSGSLSPRGSITYDPAATKRSANKYVSGDSTPVELVGDEERGTYRVLVEGDGFRLSAAVPVCMLRSSEFHEQLTLHLDSKGVPWHLDYLVSATSCEPRKKLGRSPKTQVFLERAIPGARPKLDQIVDVPTVDGKPVVEKTFLQKYWYYLVPVGLMLLLQTGAPDEEPAKK